MKADGWILTGDGSVSLHLLEPSGSVSGTYPRTQNDDLVIRASLRVNMILLLGKGFACAISSSPAILASLVDSSVDVLVQAALFWASRVANAKSNLYPVGRRQLEPVAVLVIASDTTLCWHCL